MLPINRRLKKASFEEIMKDGLFLHGDSFYARILAPTSLKLRGASLIPSKFAFVVPVKVKKTSVGRHLIKRRMSTVVEKLLITLKPAFSMVIFAKKDVSKLPFSAIEQEITELLRKGKLLS